MAGEEGPDGAAVCRIGIPLNSQNDTKTKHDEVILWRPSKAFLGRIG
jgi:hypothetical protein